MGEYSYTTITQRPGARPDIGVSLHPVDLLSVLTPRGGDRAQISILHDGVCVTVAPMVATSPTTRDVEIARQLAREFAAYAVEVERLHAQVQHTPEGSASSEGAAA